MDKQGINIVEGAGLRFLLALPERGGGPCPVIVFLHGYDEGAPVEIRTGVMRHGPLNATASPRARDFIIVAPQLPRKGDLWSLFFNQVVEIVRQVQAQHRGDRSRTYLTGFSFGGNGVFDLALADPSVWAALWPVDPTRVPVRDPGLPVWLSSGQVSRRDEQDFIRRLHLKVRGEDEPGERVYLDEGFDHVGTAASAYASDEIYIWLLARQVRR